MWRIRPLAGSLGLVALAAAASPDGRVYALDPKESSVSVQVGKAGLLKFAGHEHRILAPRIEGRVLVRVGSPADSSVSFTVDARGMSVSPEGEPPQDVAKVQEKMLSAEVLDVGRFPMITFESRSIAAADAANRGAYELRLTGDLSLHGVTRSVTIPLRVEISGEALTATGTARIRQSDFGMHPVSVAGVVNVKDEVTIQLRIVARPRADGAE